MISASRGRDSLPLLALKGRATASPQCRNLFSMNPYIVTLFFSLFLSSALAGEYGELIFHDTFDRSESQELKDEPGNNWTTSSDKTAKGFKQIDLRDGHVYIYTHAEANHATSFRQAFEFQDGTIGLRFMFEDERDALTANFADMELKSVWAGHLFKVTIGTKDVQLIDQKTAQMDLTIRNARAKGTLTKKQEAMVASKSISFPHTLETNRWHTVRATVIDDELICSINGNAVGSFKSEGFAHPTKGLLRLLVPYNAHVDDVKIWRKK